VSDQLGQGTFLEQLFQPVKATAPLMNTLLALMKAKSGGPVRIFLSLNWSLLRRTPFAFLLGAVIGIASTFGLAWITGGTLTGKGAWGCACGVGRGAG
jgi:hypothetical protein